MKQIRTGILVLLVFHYLDSTVVQADVNTNETQRTTFPCENGNEIDFLDVCDGVWNCEDGTDEKVCENEALLLYYAYDVGIVRDVSRVYCAQRYEEKMRSCDSSLSRNDCIRESVRYVVHLNSCPNDLFDNRYENLNLTGIYLTFNNEFQVPIVKNRIRRGYNQYHYDDFFESAYLMLRSNIEITTNGPQLDVFSANDVNFRRRRTTRHGGVFTDITTKQGNITNPVVDWFTSNIYYISESRIKVCDRNFIICIPIQSKFIKNPTLLAISPKQRLLFWVERKSESVHNLVAYPLDKNVRPSPPIRRDLRNPKWVTVDLAQDRIYWLDGDKDGTMRLFSSTFEGTNVKIISPGAITIPGNASFAVFDNTIYWPHSDQKKIMKCSANNCNDSVTVFKQVIVDSDAVYSTGSKLGYFIIDHRSLNSNKTSIALPCDNSSCSHFCLSASESEYQCYCQESDSALPINSSGLCKDNTLIAVYHNFLSVVGLFDKDSPNTFTKTHEYRINISTIAAVAYNSINENIILSEVGEQKVYSWVPLSGELKLILNNGPGTINALEFDNYANNLYWIDPTVSAIKVMNLNTGIGVNILKGNVTYAPIQFTLIQTLGCMAVLFLRDSSSITIERVSMDGGSYSRKVLYEDVETYYGVEDLALYYNKEFRWIYLLDRQTNEIRVLSEKMLEFQRLANTISNTADKIKNIAFLRNYIIWSEDGPVMKKANVDAVNFQIDPVQEISLNYDRSSEEVENGVVRLLGIERQIVEPRLAKCLVNNGGCQKLCLTSRKHTRFTCSCPEGEELVNDTSCRKAERPPVQGERNTSKISSNANVDAQSSASGSDPDAIQTPTFTETVEKHSKNNFQKKNLNTTEIAGPDPSHMNHTIREPPSTNNSSCAGPVPQQELPVTSIALAVCYTILFTTITIAIIVFVAVYLYRRIGSHTSSRSWELANMNAESTVSICPRDDDLSRVLPTQNRQ